MKKQKEDSQAGLDKVVEETRRFLQAERDQGVPSQEQVDAGIKKAVEELEVIRGELKKAKKQVKKRKKEIHRWKEWYNRLEQDDKSAELEQLQQEISWRAGEIARQEAEIARLYSSGIESEGKLEHLNVQLNALKEGVYEKPLEEDPRLRSIIRERDEIKKKVSGKSGKRFKE